MATTINISAAQLIGKLHEAAIAKVNEKWRGQIEITNTAIDLSKKKNPMAVLEGGEYKIICRGKSFTSEKEMIEPIKTYLTWFAGADVANSMTKKAGFFKSLWGKLRGKDMRSDLEKTKTNKAVFEIPYTLNVESGTKQSEEDAVEQQSDQQQDNLNKTQPDAADTKTNMSGKDKSTIEKLASGSTKVTQQNLAQAVDAFAKMGKNQTNMTVGDMVTSLKAIDRLSKNVSMSEASIVDTAKKVLGTGFAKGKEMFKNLYAKAQKIGTSKAKANPEIKTFSDLYKAHSVFLNAEKNDLIDFEDSEANGKKISARLVKQTELRQFAADLEQVAKLYRSKMQDGKLKIGKNKSKPAGESINVSMKFNGIDETFIFEAVSHYNEVTKVLLEESMKKQSEKLVNAIVNKKNLKANRVLENILKAKVQKRLTDVLDSVEK